MQQRKVNERDRQRTIEQDAKCNGIKKTQNIVIEMRNRNGLWRTVSQTMKNKHTEKKERQISWNQVSNARNENKHKH